MDYKKDRHTLRRFLRRCTSIPNKDIRKMSYKKMNSIFLKYSTYAVRYLLDKYQKKRCTLYYLDK